MLKKKKSSHLVYGAILLQFLGFYICSGVLLKNDNNKTNFTNSITYTIVCPYVVILVHLEVCPHIKHEYIHKALHFNGHVKACIVL